MSSKKSRLQWSMSNAFKAVKLDDNGLRQALREFGVPVTTRKRRVDDVVPLNAKPGPADHLARTAPRILPLAQGGRGLASHAHGSRRSSGPGSSGKAGETRTPQQELATNFTMDNHLTFKRAVAM